jgi:hypothetical protein
VTHYLARPHHPSRQLEKIVADFPLAAGFPLHSGENLPRQENHPRKRPQRPHSTGAEATTRTSSLHSVVLTAIARATCRMSPAALRSRLL